MKLDDKKVSSRDKIKDIFEIIWKLWVKEELGVYKIWNRSILANYLYSILGQYVNVTKLISLKSAHINVEFDGFDNKIELISHYCSLLCVMCLLTTKSRSDSRILYRAVNFITDRKYKLGEDYRFITFQSCDEEFTKAIKFLNLGENSFYTMTLTPHWNNGVHMQNNNQEKEYLIMPFSSFSMDSNILTFLENYY